MEPDAAAGPVLSIAGLSTHIRTKAGTIRAVDDVSLTIGRGETVGIVGESGSGKSMLALSIMGLVPEPAGRIVAGRIELGGVGDLTRLDRRALRTIRGSKVAMIFQDPMSSLNPVFRVGRQIGEAIRAHEDTSKAEARRRAIELLGFVGIASPEQRVDSYPHQMSGGMRQRVMIAMALACRPQLMLADEPTTALDVTIQAQILHLMNRLKRDVGTAIMFITHDLGVIAKMAQRVGVMYAGVLMEIADVRSLFAEPLHPYTQGLLAAIPRAHRQARKAPLGTIPGSVPNLLRLGPGCRFADRCAQVHDRCRMAEPPLAAPTVRRDAGRLVRCWLHAASA